MQPALSDGTATATPMMEQASCGLQYSDGFGKKLTDAHPFLGSLFLIYLMFAVLLTPHKTLHILGRVLLFFLYAVIIVYAVLRYLGRKLFRRQGESHMGVMQVSSPMSASMRGDVMSQSAHLPKQPARPLSASPPAPEAPPTNDSAPKPPAEKMPGNWRTMVAYWNEKILYATILLIILFILDDSFDHCRVLAYLTRL